MDIAAYTLGARWVERHFTKDRSWKGTDHAASLEVPGMQKLVRDLHHAYEALSFKKAEILEIEQVQRDKLKNKKG
jgi:N-acetylneuraminate synthase